jgi:hypothetical protein
VAAAPTARSRPTTTPTAADIGEDDDEGAAPLAAPGAAEEAPEGAAGDLEGEDGDIFVPPLPEDHAGEPEAAEEAPPALLQKDPGANFPRFEPVPVDHLLEAVYGDWPHHNDGRHLDGGIPGDAAWQRRWRRIADLPSTHCSVPKGNVGRRFIDLLAAEFSGVQERLWNSERPLAFVSVVLQTTPGVKRARDIRKRLTHRMDLWHEGKIILSRHGSHPVPDEETIARAFNEKVLSGFPVGGTQPDEPRSGRRTPAGRRLHEDRPAGPRSLARQASGDARPRS